MVGSKKVKVIDARMGLGKTEYALRMMKNNPSKRYIFVTPYLSEVERVIERCGFIQPKNEQEGGGHKKKISHFKELVEGGVSIATTHQMFKMLDVDAVSLLRQWDYELVLDEVLDVISISKLSRTEFEMLEKLKLIKKDKKAKTWIKGDDDELLQKYSHGWSYSEIVRNLMRNSLEIFNSNILMWLFPTDVLESFKTTYILTYMFDGYPLRPYLELHNFEIKKYTIKNRELADYEPDDTSDLSDLVNIVEGKSNLVGEGGSSFSMYWYKNVAKSNANIILDIRKGLSNFYKNKTLKTEELTKKSSIIWTTFKGYADMAIVKGINEDNFLSHNARATNNYSHCANVAYLVNRNYNPLIKQWLIEKGLKTNDDSFALSEMIQFIWRSRIRNGENISVYIPSERMRGLLKKWLNK